jgi:glutathione synthase/RimK-type ligase-like ATP-grasp enzyme
MIDVALATCQSLPEPDADRALLLDALKEAGITAEWLAWDDPKANFKQARLTVLRSTWNYIQQRDAFIDWADALGFRLCNPPSIVRWNTHKRYLRELDELAKLPVVPTILLPKAVKAKLGDVLKAKHWFSAVAKPAIGAGSFCTRRVSSSDDDAQWLEAQLRERDMLLQPYMSNVESSGERALVYIEGEVTHAVRKSPRFTGNDESVETCEVAEDERALAHRAMSWVMREIPGGGLLYGRIDMVRDAEGAPRIMELELTEPSLFFAQNPAALAKFIAGIKRRLDMVR